MINCKKMISLLLSLIMVLSIFSIVPFGAAAAQAETDDASAAAKEPEGEPAAQEEPVPEEPALSRKADADLAATGNQYGDFYYEIYGGAATITEYVGDDTDVVIPSTINGYTVTRIGECAFTCMDMIERVTVPDTVTEIGNEAFSEMYALTEINLGSHVVSIGESAFIDCESLSSIQLPDTVTSIGAEAFYGCTSLVNFQLPPALSYLGSYALQNTAITSVTIPQTLTQIDSGAFASCASLATVSFEEGITRIPDGIFSGCGSIRQVTIPASVTEIGNSAFSGCQNLTTVDFAGNAVTSIGDFAFNDCTSLVNFQLPPALEVLSNNALSYSGITSVTIPQTLTQIDSGAFAECASLTTVSFEPGITRIPDGIFSGCGSIRQVTIPASVTEIGNSAFSGCQNLTTVDFAGNAVTSIGDFAFNDCTSLVNFQLPPALSYLGSRALQNTAITSVTIPQTLTGISSYDNPFYGCDDLKTATFASGTTRIPGFIFGSYNDDFTIGLEEIVMPDTVTEIGAYAFSGCQNLEAVTFSEYLLTIGGSAFYRCTSLTDVTLPVSLNSIADSAFRGCTGLTSVTIPGFVTSIGEWAFADCTALSSVTLPNRLQYLGSMAFGKTAIQSVQIPKTLTSAGLTSTEYGNNGMSMEVGPFGLCDQLTTVTFETGTTVIPGSLFTGCTGLGTVTIPDTVTEIGTKAFSYCLNLETVNFGSAVESIRAGAFSYCESLDNVELPDTVINLDAWSGWNNIGVFEGCTSLSHVELPQNLSYIPGRIFYGCSSLTSFDFSQYDTIWEYSFAGTGLTTVTLPKKLRDLNNGAFGNCASLTSVSFSDFSITQLNSSAFENDTALTSIVLPKGLTQIWGSAFAGCSALTDITIPATVNQIEGDLFVYPGRATIRGFAGSYAEQYANDRGINFVDTYIPSTAFYLTADFDSYYNSNTNTYEIPLMVGESVTLAFDFVPSESNDYATLTCTGTSGCNVEISENTITATGFYNGYGYGTAIVNATSTGGQTIPINIRVMDITDIYITQLPNKMIYTLGESFDPTGMYVEAYYSGTGNVPLAPEDYTITGFDSDTIGMKHLTVAYTKKDGSRLEQYFDVEVKDPRGDVIGIKIAHLPDTIKYVKRTAFDPTGLQVEKIFEDGSTEALSAYEYTVNAPSLVAAGRTVVSVNYQGFNVRFPVFVYETAGEIPSGNPLQPPTGIDFYATGDFNGWNYQDERYKLNLVQTDDGYEYQLACDELSPGNYVRIVDSNGNWTTEINVNDTLCDTYLIHFVDHGFGRSSLYQNGFLYIEYAAHTNHRPVADHGYAATCTEPGLSDGTHCELCGEVLEAQQVIPATGHTAVIDAAVPATCTETGLTQGSHCAVCGEVLEARQVTPATGHSPVTDPAVEPGCTTFGYTEGSHCSVCGEVLVPQQAIPMLMHHYVKVDAVAPTCTLAGFTMGVYCDRCNEVLFEPEVIPASGHIEVADAAVEASCTESGLTAGSHCAVCGDILELQQVIPATGHTVVIDAAVEATCTESGLTAGSHCAVCGDILELQQVIPATGHTVVIDAAVEATCTETGLTQGSHCAACGEVLERQEVIPMLGHHLVVVDGVPEEVNQTGLTMGIRCDRCDEWLVEQQIIPAIDPTIGPKIITQPTSWSGYVGETTHITVEAEGSALFYQWYYRPVGKTNWVKAADNDTCYDIKMTNARDGREIYCKITDRFGNVAETDVVTMNRIEYNGPTITKQPEDWQGYYDQQTNITVEAEGLDLTYQWYYRNAGKTSWVATDDTDACYDIEMTTARDGRQVCCKITDRFGISVITDTVTMSYLPYSGPAILSEPSDWEGQAGEIASVAIEAEGLGLTYQWFYRNAGKTNWVATDNFGTSYEIEMSAARDGRQVYCKVTDRYGNVVPSRIATLRKLG